MKKYAAILLVFMLAAVPAAAQSSLFEPLTSLRVIRTDHFDIIFPRESERSARLLASYADRVYEQLSSLLGIEVPGRIPVVFTPHTDLRNGFYSPLSTPHIMLFDTHEDLVNTNSDDSLKRIFIHELAHAITMNSRGPFFRGLHRIFGNWVIPAAVNAPLFMIEGAAISLESLSGFGRSNDPRVRQFIRQAIHEGKFLTPFQASGVYDIPMRESFYEYGGLFSTWLLDTFGMEKYAELWQEMGRRFYFSFSVYQSGFYRIFRNVYGMDFIDAWNAFGASLALDGLEENPSELLPRTMRFFCEKRTFIQGLIARENKLFFFNITDRKINIFDTVTGDLRSFNAGPAYDFDVSPDGSTLLLSGYRLVSAGVMFPGFGRHSAVVTEIRADSGQITGRRFHGLYRARYFRDGVIGLRSDLHNTRIVFEDFEGNSEILFQGSERLLFSGPQALDDERFVFIASYQGERELWLFNYVSRELFRIETGDGNYRMRFIRDLGVSGDRLFFSHNSNDRMYKLGFIDFVNMQAVFNDRDFSGGVFHPVSVNDNIYYLGAFTHRDRLLRFPETAAALSGKRSEVTLVRLNLEEINNPAGRDVFLPYSGDSRAYIALRYMNPFNFWFPLPLLRTQIFGIDDFRVSLDGGGILSYMADPAGRNLIILEAYADVRYQMAMINEFSWQNTTLGFPLTATFTDRVLESGDNVRRSTSGSIDVSLQQSIGQWSYRFSFGAGYFRNAIDNGERSAYNWEETNSGFLLYSGFSLWYRRTALHFSAVNQVNYFEPRLEAVFRTRTDTRFPMRFTVFGAHDSRGMDLFGRSSSYGRSLITAHTLTEYPHPAGLSFNWLAGAELALDLFSFEIQRNISHLYFNRVFGSLALRNQIFDAKDHPAAPGMEINNLHLAQSLLLRLGLRTSFFPVVKFPATIEPFFFAAWRLSNTITGSGSPFHFGWTFNWNLNI